MCPGEGVLLFGATLVCSWDSTGCFPHPHHSLPSSSAALHTPGLWLKPLQRAGSSSRQEGYHQPLQISHSGLLKFPGWALMRG